MIKLLWNFYFWIHIVARDFFQVIETVAKEKWRIALNLIILNKIIHTCMNNRVYFYFELRKIAIFIKGKKKKNFVENESL